jgi:beta-phosphoglucomutase
VSRGAVVWDLDGVIVDSAAAHDASWAAMAAEFGVPYSSERDFQGIFGRHNSDIITSLWGVTDPDVIARMTESKERAFRAGAASLKPLPGVLALMQAAIEAGWPQAIGSSAPMENIRLLMAATGTAGYMDAIASGDDVTRGKPDPEVFLLAFKRLHIVPRHGVVIEDAPAGIKAAVAAGAAALGVTTTQTREALLEAGAHRVVESLEEVGIDDLIALVRSVTG